MTRLGRLIVLVARARFAALCCAVGAACTSAPPAPPPIAAPPPVAVPAPPVAPAPPAVPSADAAPGGPSAALPATRPWKDAHEATSNGGTYLVRWRARPDPIPRGQPFALDVWVFAPGGADEPLLTTALSVDADMPEHLHGMNRVPRVERNAALGFRVEGMLFHMPGRWELDFDVRSGAVTERAQVQVELE